MTAIGCGAPLRAEKRAAASAIDSPRRTCTPLAMKTARTPKFTAPAISVAMPSPIASTRSLATGRAAQSAGKLQRQVVDRLKRLARVAHRAAQRLVGRRDRAGAINDTAVALDGPIRVGADHRHGARFELCEHGCIIGGRFRLVVVKAGANCNLGIVRGGTRNGAKPGEDRQIALGADVQNAPPGPGLDQTRARHRPNSRSHRKPCAATPIRSSCRLTLSRGRGAVGDEQDGAALLSKRFARSNRRCARPNAVVYHAPDVDEPKVGRGSERRNRRQNRNVGHLRPGTRRMRSTPPIAAL